MVFLSERAVKKWLVMFVFQAMPILLIKALR